MGISARRMKASAIRKLISDLIRPVGTGGLAHRCSLQAQMAPVALSKYALLKHC